VLRLSFVAVTAFLTVLTALTAFLPWPGLADVATLAGLPAFFFARVAAGVAFRATGVLPVPAVRGEAFLPAVFAAPGRPFGAVRRLEPGALRLAITIPFVTGLKPEVTLTVSGKWRKV